MHCRKECNCQSFGFRCNAQEAARFYVSEWGRNRKIFFVYRLLMALNSLGWTIGYYIWCKAHCSEESKHSYRYITLWADFLRTTYFVTAAVLTVLGLWHKERSVDDRGPGRWLRQAVWLLHTLAMSSNAAVAVFFWPFVAPHLEPDVALSVINVFLHAVNLALMLVDLLIVAFPIRLLHLLYSVLLGIVYCIHTIILWQVDDTHAVYGVLDWKNNPKSAGVFFAATILIGAPVVQVITFALYLLRRKCHTALNNSRQEGLSDNVENLPLKDDNCETKAISDSGENGNV